MKDLGWASTILRAAGIIGLVILALFYVFFGLNALVHHAGQGASAFLGGVALGWGSARFVMRAPAAKVICLGTMPLAVVHLLLTIGDPGELGYLLASLPVPVVAGAIWIAHR